jgi:hypothetical protein
MTATTIHIWGTLRRYAAIATPTIKMMNPMRYVAKEDMLVAGGWWLVVRCQMPLSERC